MAESRRERESVLSEYKKQAEEKKEFADKVEKRVSGHLLLPLIDCMAVFLFYSCDVCQCNMAPLDTVSTIAITSE